MNKVDKKIKLILSKELEVSNKFRETVNSCIDNLPEHRSRKEKKFNIIKLIQIVTIGILSIGVTAFAHSEIQKIEKSKINQNISEVNDEIKVDTYYDSNGIEMHQYNFKYPLDTNDWESSNLYEYLKITTMKEYNEYKEKYADVFELEKMTEEDFENNFLLVLRMVENSYIYDVSSDNNILHINIIRNFENATEDMDKIIVVSLKISRELDMEKIEMNEFPEENEYKAKPYIKDLVKNDYSKESAIKDGAIVTDFNKTDYKSYIISNNKEKLDEFIEKTKNGIESQIRIIEYETGFTRFCDLKYENGMYKAYIYIKPLKNENFKTSVKASYEFIRGKEIKINYSDEIKSYTYFIIENTNLHYGDIELPMTENRIIFEYNVE